MPGGTYHRSIIPNGCRTRAFCGMRIGFLSSKSVKCTEFAHVLYYLTSLLMPITILQGWPQSYWRKLSVKTICR